MDHGEAHSGCGGREKSEQVQLSAFRIAVDASGIVLSSELPSEFWWPLPLLIKGTMRKLQVSVLSGDSVRTTTRETVFQRALRNCSEDARAEVSIYVILTQVGAAQHTSQ